MSMKRSCHRLAANMEFTINIDATGDFSEEDLKQFIMFSLGIGSCDETNPFIDEDCDAEILDIDIY